ncbi:MAG: IS630 family transposase [Gammaproteobacteria bacterium]|nr:MAG: IS630 family transposase [Gammaproteobacteria bacterium]
MAKINLTNDERVNLDYLHEQTRDGRVRDRIKAVLLCSEGWSTTMISQALRLHETTINRHINDYLADEKLKPENGGSKGYLSKFQTEEVIQHLMEKTYRCSYEIIDYIFEIHSIRFSISGLNKWLHHHGFSYKKPKGVPHKFDPIKQAEFIEKYEALKAKNTDEPILFIDAMHPTQATKVSGGWIKKGHDKAIKTTGSRTRLNIVGAIDLNDLGSAIVNRYEKVNSETMQSFFETIRQKYPPKKTIHLILDGAGYHRAIDLKEKAKELNIELFYLPPYSPNLNPIERLWKVMNEHVRNNQYFSTAKEFRDKIDDFFQNKLPEIGNDLKSRINDNFQILNPAP